MLQLPQELRNPVMIFKGSVDNSLVAITQLKDKENREIMVAISLSEKDKFREVNRISSAYGRNNMINYLQRQMSVGNLIAANKQKAERMLHSAGLQLPMENTFISFDNSISYSTQNVNISKRRNDIMMYKTIVKDDGTISIVSCNSAERDIVIPDTIDGCKVTEIGGSAFKDCAFLKSVTIPNGVTSIGDWAFSYCTSLKMLAIPDGVTSIGEGAFLDCESLTSVTVPDSVTSIGSYAFLGCTNLTSITIPDSVKSIGYDAFEGFTSLNVPEKCTFVSPEQLNKLRKSGINIQTKQTEDNRIIVKYKAVDEQRVKKLITEEQKQNKHMKRWGCKKTAAKNDCKTSKKRDLQSFLWYN